MSQILSLERSASLHLSFPLSTFPHLLTHATRPHILSLAGKHAFPHIHILACSHVTSSRWLDNLHQFDLAKKTTTLITTISLLTLLARIQWVFSLCLRATDSARRWKLERPSSPLPCSYECRHHSRLLTSVLGYCQKLHIFMKLVMEAGSTVGDGDDMEKEVDTQRV